MNNGVSSLPVRVESVCLCVVLGPGSACLFTIFCLPSKCPRLSYGITSSRGTVLGTNRPAVFLAYFVLLITNNLPDIIVLKPIGFGRGDGRVKSAHLILETHLL